MPFPTQTFNTIAEWIAWIDTNIIPNGNQEIVGNDGNITERAAAKFIERSPLNWDKADVVNSSSAYTAQKAVVVFTGVSPASLTWTDNIYNEYLFINMTGFSIPVLSPLVYYGLSGAPKTVIPANSSVNIFKAENDLWVQGTNDGGSISPTSGVNFIPIYGSDFINETDYPNSNLDGQVLRVFYVGIPNYLEPLTQWQYLTGGGISVNLGFDIRTIGFFGYIDIRENVELINPSGETYSLTEDTEIPSLSAGNANEVRTISIVPNGFNYTWSNTFLFSVTWPEQPGAVDVGTIQVYTFQFIAAANMWVCIGQSINVIP